MIAGMIAPTSPIIIIMIMKSVFLGTARMLRKVLDM